ncbi:MAG TPA: YkgJ family cysteine cluster protein [Candidatus Nanoarchaeia archaeon]|nr:YkgJ family cysteine cluster protein [Candidatus Nanoarchaeia archaeon]
MECRYDLCNAKCCRNLEYRKLGEYDLDTKRYLHFLVPNGMIGLSVFNDEKETLEKEGVKFIPMRGVISSKGHPVIIKWLMDYTDCPLLKENKCMAYEKRPLICRLYPLMPPLLCEKGKKEISAYCPHIKITTEEMITNFDKFIKRQEAIMNNLNKLKETGKIKLIKTSTAMRLFSNKRIITFEDYLAEQH